MKNRAILARQLAMAPKKGKKVKEITETPAPKVNTPAPKETLKLAMINPEDGETVKEFDSYEQAVEEGFSLPNLKGAVKNKNKYKGHFWAEVK